MSEETTTIQITKEDDERLVKLKLHPSQPIKEVVQMLLDDKESDEITISVMKDRWEMIVELSDFKGRKKEELLKRGFI